MSSTFFRNLFGLANVLGGLQKDPSELLVVHAGHQQGLMVFVRGVDIPRFVEGQLRQLTLLLREPVKVVEQLAGHRYSRETDCQCRGSSSCFVSSTVLSRHARHHRSGASKCITGQLPRPQSSRVSSTSGPLYRQIACCIGDVRAGCPVFVHVTVRS